MRVVVRTSVAPDRCTPVGTCTSQRCADLAGYNLEAPSARIFFQIQKAGSASRRLAGFHVPNKRISISTVPGPGHAPALQQPRLGR